MMRIALLVLLAFASPAFSNDWESGFADPGPEHAVGVYWWWFGPAQTKDEVDRELHVMKEARIGRVLIFPIYPIAADDPARGIQNYPYLSAKFLDVLRHTVQTAQRLGIEVDLLPSTGWPYGGSWIPESLSARRLRVEGKSASQILPEHSVVARIGPMVFFDAPTGMRVKRPALGAEGFVMDHLSREALSHHLTEVGDKLLDAAPGIRAIHSDSMEVYGQNWTKNFASEFKKRRGYALEPHLPALFDKEHPQAPDIRHDYWLTISDLVVDHYIKPLAQWTRSRGVGLQAESYGTPAVDMRTFAHVDHPMGESYDWKTFVASRWASSAAHQFGKRITAAEALTWLRQPRYISTLEDMKVGADLHFACGINKIIAHGYAYSPPSAGVPGWGYYASVMLNDRNTLWPFFPLLSGYIRRASYALSLGKPRVDIGVYLPEDDVRAAQGLDSGPDLYKTSLNLYMATKYHLGTGAVPEFGLPAAYASETPLIKTILSAGFGFDGFDHAILRPELHTEGGRLAIGDVAYRIAVLPNVKGISTAMLERLADFCRAGGVLIATRRLPDTAYGLKDRERSVARVRDLVAELFGKQQSGETRRRTYGKGLAIFVPDETKELAAVLSSLRPQIRLGHPDSDLVFIQRGAEERELYFLANTSDRKKTFRALFRDGKGRPRMWDAMTGQAWDLPDDGNSVTLTLEPYASIFVAFEGLVETTAAKAAPAAFAERASIAAPGPWLLDIEGRQVKLDDLKSWTAIPDYHYYSGRGDYRTEIRIPANWLNPGDSVWLDLGSVKEVADVSINGKPAGVCWMRPYRLEVSDLVRPGMNQIRIGVTNLLINAVLGQPTPDFSKLKVIQFPLPTEKKMIKEPLPSGLLGPVRVVQGGSRNLR